MEYDKPHLDYNAQVQRLISRGLDVPDRARAVAALKSIGYYRLSAYTYPLRKPGAEARTRSSDFVEGATLEEVLHLYAFDEKLRTELLAGLQRLEVGLRVQIGYTLGKRDRYGHLDASHLDPVRCAEVTHREDGTDTHGAWLARYDRQQGEAKNEDFVKHFILKYDGKMPIWAATEFMSFGTLTKLYELLCDKDANVIARNLAVPPGRDVLVIWFRALNTLRNHCAHNSRIWNRATIYPPTRLPLRAAPERIAHLATANNNRVYYLAALCAHLLLAIDPVSPWPRQFVTTMRKYTPVHGMTPQNTMGFPDEWDRLDLWALRK